MGISMEGLDTRIKSLSIITPVKTSDVLVRLANLIEWQHLAELSMPDLQKTDKGYWWVGRKLNLRCHLATMILQSLLKQTDRGTERQILQTPIFQVFCGYGSLDHWKCPDHTKIEEFRNRLSPESHKKIGDYVIKLACSLGFANPTWMDVDSTIQEANITYPSDAKLMRKLAQKCFQILSYLKEKEKKYLPKTMEIDIQSIGEKAKEYFFIAKNTHLDKKRDVFRSYHHLVKRQLKPMIKFCENLPGQALAHLLWNIRRSIGQISLHG